MEKLKTIKYIKLDDVRGILYAAGRRSLLFPVEFVNAVTKSFKNFVEEPVASILLYEMGENLGKEYAKTLKAIEEREGIELEEEIMIKESYSAISMESGWGTIEFKKFDLKKEEIILESTNSPCLLVPKTGYELLRGILAGAYKEITGRTIYYKVTKENKKRKKVILEATKEIPEEILNREKMILWKKEEKERLESMVRQRTKELQAKVEELEKFHKLAVGRELKMIELKEKIKELEERLEKCR